MMNACTLKRTVILVLSICMALGLSSCALSDDKFPARDEIAAYIEETFPGKTYTLSDSARTIRGVTGSEREWTFTLDDYPGYKFHANARCGWGMLPFDYSIHKITNDAYATVAQDILSEKNFYKGVLQKDYPELCDYWDQKQVKEIEYYDSSGFNPEDKNFGYLSEFDITIPDITKLDDAQKLVGVVVNYMHEKAPELSELAFCVRMPVEEDAIKMPYGIDYDYDYGVFGFYGNQELKVYLEESFPGRDWESIYNPDDEPGYYKTWKQNLIEGICKVSAYNGVNVCGITDEEVQEWMQRVVIGGDDTFSNMGEWLTKRCIKTGDRYMLVSVLDEGTDSRDKGVYLTLGVARNFFEWCGLKVEGSRTNYEVTGVDGSIYEFAYGFQDKRKDNSWYDYYLQDGERYEWPKDCQNDDCIMNDYTIKQVSGVDIYDLLVPSNINKGEQHDN